MLRVTLVTAHSVPHAGGLSSHYLHLERQLRDAGLLAWSLTARDLGVVPRKTIRYRLWRLIGKDSGNAHALRLLQVALVRAVSRVLGPTSPTVIHCHDAVAASAALQAARNVLTPVPVVQTVHGPWSKEAVSDGAPERGSFVSALRSFEQTAYAGCAQLICVDRGQKAILEREFGVPAHRATVIPNTVDLTEVARETARVSPGYRRHFVVPRRLFPKNGVHVAVEAARLLQRDTRDFIIYVAGDGPLRASLMRQAAEAGVQDHVRFLGEVEHGPLLRLMAEGRGVIVPSVPSAGVVEATSIAALEAMACGVPVIASDIGGLREILRPRETGFLVPAGDAAGFAQVLLHLLHAGVDELAAMRCLQEGALRDELGPEQWIKRTLEVYRRVERSH